MDKIRKPKVDPEKCASCATCEAICPEVFKLGDDLKANILPDADFAAHQEAIQQSINSCPTEAISWEE